MTTTSLPPKRRQGRFTPFRIAAIYAIAGGLWILLSDRMVSGLITNAQILTRMQTYKGWLFVALTSWMLYELVTRYRVELRSAEKELRKLNRQLEQRVVERTEQLETANRELGEANTRLKEVDRLKSLFIASMSHELRTPLNSIIGFTSILLNEWAGAVNDEQKDNLATVLKSGKHLLALINDVIDVSKIEAGAIDVHAEDFDLHDVVSEVARLFEKEARDKGLEFAVENLHQPMRSDRRRLLQCVMNLVSNAVKFTEKGSVRVSVRRVRSSAFGVRRNT